MKRFVGVLVAGITLAASPAYSCSGTDLAQRLRAVAEAAKAAYARDPVRYDALKPQVDVIVERYSGLKSSTNGPYIIDMMCKQNDELMALYK
jgi:hypothetical protein